MYEGDHVVDAYSRIGRIVNFESSDKCDGIAGQETSENLGGTLISLLDYVTDMDIEFQFTINSDTQIFYWVDLTNGIRVDDVLGSHVTHTFLAKVRKVPRMYMHVLFEA